MPAILHIPVDITDSDTAAALAMSITLDMMMNIDCVMSKPDTVLPSGSEEHYVWMKDTIIKLLTLRKAAEEAARKTYVEAMTNEEAVELYNEIKGRCPKNG